MASTEDVAEDAEALRITVNRLRGELWKAKEQATPRTRPETPKEWTESNTSLRDLADWVSGQARTLGFGENSSVVLDRIAEHAKHRGFTVAEIWYALIKRESVPIEGTTLDDTSLRERVLSLEREAASVDPAPDLDRDEALLRELDAIVGETSTLPPVVQEHLLATLDSVSLSEEVKTARTNREGWSRNRTLAQAYRSALNKAEASYRTLQRVDAEYPGGELAIHIEVAAEDGHVLRITVSPESSEAELVSALRMKLDTLSPPGEGGSRNAYAYAQTICDYLRLVRIRPRIRLDVVPVEATGSRPAEM